MRFNQAAVSAAVLFGSIGANAYSMAVQSCLQSTNVSLVFPDDPSYPELNTPLCRTVSSYSYQPNVLVLPRSPGEVSAAVKCVASDAGATSLTVVSG